MNCAIRLGLMKCALMGVILVLGIVYGSDQNLDTQGQIDPSVVRNISGQLQSMQPFKLSSDTASIDVRNTRDIYNALQAILLSIRGNSNTDMNMTESRNATDGSSTASQSAMMTKTSATGDMSPGPQNSRISSSSSSVTPQNHDQMSQQTISYNPVTSTFAGQNASAITMQSEDPNLHDDQSSAPKAHSLIITSRPAPGAIDSRNDSAAIQAPNTSAGNIQSVVAAPSNGTIVDSSTKAHVIETSGSASSSKLSGSRQDTFVPTATNSTSGSSHDQMEVGSDAGIDADTRHSSGSTLSNEVEKQEVGDGSSNDGSDEALLEGFDAQSASKASAPTIHESTAMRVISAEPLVGMAILLLSFLSLSYL